MSKAQMTAVLRGNGKTILVLPSGEEAEWKRELSDEECKSLASNPWQLFKAPLPPTKAPRFPTMLRKQWGGHEVQAWIDDHWTAPPAPQALGRDQILEVVEQSHVVFRETCNTARDAIEYMKSLMLVALDAATPASDPEAPEAPQQPDIYEAVMNPEGVCPTCFQRLHIDPASAPEALTYRMSSKELKAQAIRDGITTLLRQCTDAQAAGLHRIHDAAPWKGLSNCPENKLDESYELLRRTVANNVAALAATSTPKETK